MDIFRIFRKSPLAASQGSVLNVKWMERGVAIELATRLQAPYEDTFIDSLKDAGPADTLLGVYLTQLVQEGRCEIDSTSLTVPWENIYSLLRQPEHQSLRELLALPPVGELRPILNCRSTLSEPDFVLMVETWTDGQRRVVPGVVIGSVATVEGQQQLLPEAAWRTLNAITQFGARGDEQRTQHAQELAWGQIRAWADIAGALYASPYLESTIVLTPQTLRLLQSKEETPFGAVITVTPTFAGAPSDWISAFDGFTGVQDHYDLVAGKGRVRVILSEPVRKVLEVIKREMPARRAAGSRAERFLHNPWAFLGEAAHEVIDPEEFERDREAVGPLATSFSVVARIEQGRLESADLSITEHLPKGLFHAHIQNFATVDELEDFAHSLDRQIKEQRSVFRWGGFDLSLDANAAVESDRCRQLIHLWRSQPEERIAFDDIYELEGYSTRIEGIGVARPIYVPVLQKPAGEGGEEPGWLPGDLTPMVRVTLQGHEGQVLIPLTKEWLNEFEGQVEKAERTGAQEVVNSSLPTPIATTQARQLVTGFRSMLEAQGRIRGDQSGAPKEPRVRRETLLVKTNFHAVDYVEERRLSLDVPADSQPELPQSLREKSILKDHQRYGVAWFQHLVSKAPVECRGALLADDMGLGKTLQLLTLLGWYYERQSDAPPSLILAPKSLLENWANEAERFFSTAYPELLTLYGQELKDRKQPLSLIDSQLQDKGIVDLLRPNWVGAAKVIITTYEVLTSYEFSFAKQPFAIVICDEAQRIKTPGTQVWKAARQLLADFRIACTGTPVENSLVDLWSLFDFVQPGLLGNLEEFGKNYRRPIECSTDEEKQALNRLQSLIAPQTLRRTKADIASQLPRKFFAIKPAGAGTTAFKHRMEQGERLEISITDYQRTLYLGGLKKLQEAATESDGRKRMKLSFGALHLMKAVCAEPYCLPGMKFLVDKGGIDQHLTNSPKLNWLLSALEGVRSAGEKAIIFTEIREVQAALFYFLRERFGLKPFIINGDSEGRQGYINRFSAKEGFDVIILSTLAAGAGLNVTAANHVFHFTRAWNPAKEAQATDRAYRIGQKRDVFVYCPSIWASDFHTFEVRLDALLKRKASLADATLADGKLGAMLNGTGGDISFTEVIGGEGVGTEVPKRSLTMDDVDRMDGFSFEVFCCLLWSKDDFQAEVTPKRGGDGGIDVLALRGDQGELLQCKSTITPALGWDAIKEVTAGAALYQARYARTTFTKVAVTNQTFNSGAVEQAAANQVKLVTRTQLEEMLGRCPISNHEFEDGLAYWMSVTERKA